MAEEKYMTRKTRAQAADEVMKVLEIMDVKEGDREREFIAILEMAAKLTLPYCHVKLFFEAF